MNASEVLRSALLGGVDGLVTSFAIVAASSFLMTPTKVVAVVGFSSLFADGVSMGVSEYLSTKSAKLVDDSSAKSLSSSSLGIVCACSFIVFGALPMLTYVLGDAALLGASSVFFAMLVALGFARAHATAERPMFAVVEVASLGVLAAGVAFSVAYVSSEIS